MMHQGLDLSRFKKVSSDKNTTTLRHSKGHEIKIAHSGLTPKMKASLEALEKHEGAQSFAEGTPDDVVQPMDAQSPAPVSPQPRMAPKPAVMPQAGTVDVVGQRPAGPRPIDPNELKMQDALWQQDLKNGHVTPETYQDLFGKKDTLGKIGTLFGMMVSGAGAGLSGQPNAVMEMMNKEISNDLEAQKQSKTNAHNFLQLNRQQNLDNAQIAQMQKEGLLTDAQAKQVRTDAETKAYTLARMQKNSAALHSLVLQVNKMPMGSPQRQEAEQQLALLSKGIEGENYNLADKAYAASALGHMAFGNPGEPLGEGGDNEDKFKQGNGVLRMSGNAPMAEDRESKHLPGVDGQASVPLSSMDRDRINAGVTFQKQLTNFIDWSKKHSGDLSPTDRNTGEAMAAQIQGAYRKATDGGVYKEGEQGFISSIIDSTPTKFFNSIRVMPQLSAVKNDSQLQLDQLLKSKGFKGYKGEKEASKFEGKTIVDGKGNRQIMKNGKWVPADAAQAKK